MSDAPVSQTPRIVQWPPRVISTTALGYIRDASGNWCPRDVGRSTILSNGQILFQFGDAFCHNLKGDFVGLANNSCGIMKNECGSQKNLTVTKYLTQYGPYGQIVPFDGEAKVADLIELLPSEDTTVRKMKIWCFSGIAETSTCESEVTGWTFFEMLQDFPNGGPTNVYQFTGLVEVSCKKLCSQFQLSTTSCDSERALFGQKEPHFGSFCILADEDFLYAYGQTGDSNPARQKDIVVARVPLLFANNRSMYTYWNGSAFVQSMKTLANVFFDMQHGQIFKTDMLGPTHKYAFIGCNAQGDSKVQFGRATTPQGPFEVVPLDDVELYALNKREDKGIFDFRYCVYPHPWAGDLSGKGDLMISWCEGGMTGGVLGAMVRLAIQ